MAIFVYRKMEVAVTYNWEKYRRQKSVLSRMISHFQIDGNTVTFNIRASSKFVSRSKWDIFFIIFTYLQDSPERTIPDKDNPEVIYFGPGIHTVKNGELRVPSGKTVYLAGGAVLMGSCPNRKRT